MAHNRARFALAAFLWAQLALLVFVKLDAGRAGDLLWASHGALLLTALGVTLNRPKIWAAAFVLIATLHAIWLGDFLIGSINPDAATGLGRYLDGAPPIVWASTAHHFYLLPLLAWLCHRHPTDPIRALAVGCAAFAFLLAWAALLSEPASNVNWSQSAFPTLDLAWVHAANAMHPTWRLIATAATVWALACVPGAFGLAALARPLRHNPSRSCARTEPGHRSGR